MPYFLRSNCPVSLGTSVAGPALLLGTGTYCLSLPAYQTVPSAPAHSHFLFQGICSAPERRGRASKWKDCTYTFSPYSTGPCTWYLTPYAQRIKKEKGENQPNKQTNNALAAIMRHTGHLQIVFLRNMC